MFAATAADQALPVAAVYGPGPGAWPLARAGNRGAGTIAVVGTEVWAAFGDDAGSAEVLRRRADGSWASVAPIQSMVPLCAAAHAGAPCFGGRSLVDGRAYLAQGPMLASVAIPVVPAQDERLSITALAELDGVLYAALAAEDALTGRARGGALLALDDQVGACEVVAALEGEAPRALCAAEGTIYVATTAGRVLWLDASGRLVPEAGVPQSDGALSLLAHAGRLWVGVRTTTGAQLLCRDANVGGGQQGGLRLFAVSPAFGPEAGGTTITLTGAELDTVTSVTVGGVPLLNLVVVSPSELRGETMAHAPGPVDVVAVSATASKTLPGAFRYDGANQQVSFDIDIKPVLVAYCATCHSPPLDTYANVTGNGMHGPRAVARQPSQSHLYLELADTGAGGMQAKLPGPPSTLRSTFPALVERWILQNMPQ
jgi:hypothetical protein